ncbi:MAG: biotin transporter BioY [Treponema sp.]|nr:biotin transporter BioY [Treponema sp.]
MNKSTLSAVYIALFAALICFGCFISIPVGLIPITFQNMFAIMSGVMLGDFSGAVSAAIFLVLGSLGLPVFSGVKGGLAVVLGPTGGFLAGYLAGALIAGLIAGKPRLEEKNLSPKAVLKISLAVILGFTANYIPGIWRFMSVMEASGSAKTLSETLNLCLIPFIPGDSIKIVLTIVLSLSLRPVIARYLTSDEDTDE